MIVTLQLLGGLVLLVGGADLLVRGAARLARMLGLSPFAIGVTVVAFGTSAPELFASANAAWQGAGDLAVGNVVGSNIANVLLILGLTAALSPFRVERGVLRSGIPVMIGVTLVASPMLGMGDRALGRVEGGFLVAGLVAYIVHSYIDGRKNPDSLAHDFEREVTDELHLDRPEPRSRLWIDLTLIVAGLAGLTLGSDLLVAGATVLATDVLGVSAGVVGLTVVAFGTSLPELAASVRACLGREHAMAMGNVIGSNVFNLLCVLGFSSLLAPVYARDGIETDLLIMIASAMLCFPLLAFARLAPQRTVGRAQGVLMVLLYAGYTAYVFADEKGALPAG
ncbi:MAG: calcium/sodium antiporter [Phycisphaerales bacterium JB040]